MPTPPDTPKERFSVSLARRWRDDKWILVAAVIFVALLLSITGAWIHCDQHKPGAPWYDRFYLALQLFTLNANLDAGAKNDFLIISLFLAPFATVFTAFVALLSMYNEQLRLLFVRFCYSDHAIICGNSTLALELVRDLALRQRVVLIHEDEEDDLIPVARDYGAIVMIGDPGDRRTLLAARADRARQLFALQKDDLANLKIADRAAEARTGTETPLQVFIHIGNLALWGNCCRQKPDSERARSLSVQYFNIYAASARAALADMPLDPDHYGAHDPRTIHLVIIGFGEMGESIAIQALQQGHFANQKPIRITVIDNDPEKQKESAFRWRYPVDRIPCSLEFINSTAERREFRTKIEEWSRDPLQILDIAVCLDDDSKSLALGMELAEVLKLQNVPVRVRTRQPAPLSFTAKPAAANRSGGLCVFGEIKHVCTEKNVVLGERDVLAKEIHAHYEQAREKKLGSWENLNEDIRDSNRQQADHIEVKLRALNCYAARQPAHPDDQLIESFSEADIEPLAIAEHHRWCARSYFAGWKHAEIVDKDKRLHWCLVPWEDLPKLEPKAVASGKKKAEDPSYQENDRNAVRTIPLLMKKVGKNIYRRASVPAKHESPPVLLANSPSPATSGAS